MKKVTVEKEAGTTDKKKSRSESGFISSLKSFFTTDLKNIGNREYVKQNKKRYIAAGSALLGVIVVVVAVVLIVTLSGGGGTTQLPLVEDPQAVAEIDDALSQSKRQNVELGENASNVKQASDGTVVYQKDDNTLVMLDSEGNEIVLSDDLYQFSITPDGLITFLGSETMVGNESVCTLYYYNKGTGQINVIAENVVKFSSAVSYDGSSLAYTQLASGGGYELYLIADMNDPTAVALIDTAPDGMTAQSVANGGGLVIYEKCTDENQTLCAYTYSSNSVEEIDSFEMAYNEPEVEGEEGYYVFNPSSIFANKTGTEAFIIYYGIDEAAHCYYKASGSPTVVIPVDGSAPQFVEPKFHNSSIYSVTTRSCITNYYPIDNFVGMAFITDVNDDISNKLYAYVPGASEATVVGEGITDASLTGDMGTLAFIYGNELTTVTLTGGKVGSPSIIADDAVVFDFNTDSSRIYYINYRMQLYRIADYGTPEMLAENIDNTFCATDTAGNSVLYYESYDQDTAMGKIVMRNGSNVTTIAENAHFAEANGTLSTIRYYKNVKAAQNSGYTGDLFTYSGGRESAGPTGVNFSA